MRHLFVCGGLVLVCLAVLGASLPSDEPTTAAQVTRSPETEFKPTDPDDDFPTFDDEPSSNAGFMTRIIGGLGRIINSVMQIPSLMARAFNFFVTNQPFSKLREEVRNLNISYPKAIF